MGEEEGGDLHACKLSIEPASACSRASPAAMPCSSRSMSDCNLACTS